MSSVASNHTVSLARLKNFSLHYRRCFNGAIGKQRTISATGRHQAVAKLESWNCWRFRLVLDDDVLALHRFFDAFDQVTYIEGLSKQAHCTGSRRFRLKIAIGPGRDQYDGGG